MHKLILNTVRKSIVRGRIYRSTKGIVVSVMIIDTPAKAVMDVMAQGLAGMHRVVDY